MLKAHLNLCIVVRVQQKVPKLGGTTNFESVTFDQFYQRFCNFPPSLEWILVVLVEEWDQSQGVEVQNFTVGP